MIKIYLLPKHHSYKPGIKRAVFGYVLFLLLMVLALGSFKLFYMDYRLASVSSKFLQQAQMEKNVEMAGAATLQLSTVREIWQLETERRRVVLLLADIQRRMPYPNVWLLSYTHKNGILHLKAMATDISASEIFVAALNNNPYLEKTSLPSYRRENLNGHNLISFELEGRNHFVEKSLFDVVMAENGGKK